MFYLIGSIITSAIFGLCFKLIGKLKMHALSVIIINYFTAASFGFWLSKDAFNMQLYSQASWFWVAVLLGLVFIIALYSIAKTTTNLGVSVAQVVNKMSMVLPIIAATFLYKTILTNLQIVGIILAFIAVYLVTKKHQVVNVKTKNYKAFLMPVIIFLCSGLIDTTIGYVQLNLLGNSDSSSFVSTVFFSAGCIGLIWITYLKIMNRLPVFTIKTILAGVLLGLINFLTIYLLFQALASNVLPTVLLFPINNIAILILATIISFLLFKEKLSLTNWTGIFLSVLAIILLGF